MRRQNENWGKAIDYEKLRTAIKIKLSRTHESYRSVRTSVGIAQATFGRFINHQKTVMDVSNVLRVCQWLEMPIENFMVGHPNHKIKNYTGDTMEGIRITIQEDKDLDLASKSMLIELMEFAYRREVNV